MTPIRVLIVVMAILVMSLQPGRAEDKSFILATTTSTENSGLLDAIIPLFSKHTGIKVNVVAVGTGQALELGRRGDAAALLTHDRMGEQAFITADHGTDRRDVMYNDFILIGPPGDPAGITGSQSTSEAFARLANSEIPFVSRGDDSGTHRKELRLWQQSGIDVSTFGKWYLEAGSGMGQTIITTMEIGGYTLADRATWSKFSGKNDYIIVFEQSPPLFNPYSSVLVTNANLSHDKASYAKQWHEWITGSVGQQAIEDYRFKGQQLFFTGTPVSPG